MNRLCGSSHNVRTLGLRCFASLQGSGVRVRRAGGPGFLQAGTSGFAFALAGAASEATTPFKSKACLSDLRQSAN